MNLNTIFTLFCTVHVPTGMYLLACTYWYNFSGVKTKKRSKLHGTHCPSSTYNMCNLQSRSISAACIRSSELNSILGKDHEA